MWEVYVEPNLEKPGADDDRPTAGPAVWARQEGNRLQGGFDIARATKEEATEFFDRICGGRVYKGPKWWENPEAHGIKTYNGPRK
jgi:hypothetical protein